MPGIVATITGHRPDKLYGYDLKAGKYWELRKRIYAALLEFHAAELWTGMAIGTDQVAALTVLDMKDDGHDIKLNAAIPFQGQESKWPEQSKLLYRAILSKCDTKRIVSAGGYSAKAMQDRNIFMADRGDYIISVWNGSPGGTGNCVRYALSRDIPVFRIHPSLSDAPRWLNRPEGFVPAVREKRRHS